MTHGVVLSMVSYRLLSRCWNAQQKLAKIARFNGQHGAIDDHDCAGGTMIYYKSDTVVKKNFSVVVVFLAEGVGGSSNDQVKIVS